MSIIHDGPAVYVNADRSAVVDGSSREAAFLMVGPGGVVKREFVDLYRKHFGLDEQAAETPKPRVVSYGGGVVSPEEPITIGESGPEIIDVPPAEVRKPRKRAAKK